MMYATLDGKMGGVCRFKPLKGPWIKTGPELDEYLDKKP